MTGVLDTVNGTYSWNYSSSRFRVNLKPKTWTLLLLNFECYNLNNVTTFTWFLRKKEKCGFLEETQSPKWVDSGVKILAWV